MQISLAKALKLKNRLAGRLNRVQEDIRQNNSVLLEQRDQIDVQKMLTQQDALSEYLIELKTKIAFANNEIQERLIRMGEFKSKLTWLSSLPTRDGIERHSYQNTELTWVATIKKADVDAQTKTLEALIDQIQDEVDGYNHTKKIEVPQGMLDAAS
jgi:hypothetical protein